MVFGVCAPVMEIWGLLGWERDTHAFLWIVLECTHHTHTQMRVYE